MSKKIAEKDFKRMLEKALQEYYEQMRSERIKNGLKQAKVKKPKKSS